MSKPIIITDEMKEKIINDFAEKLNTIRTNDGKIKYEATFPVSKKVCIIDVSNSAYLKMMALVNEFSSEVAWHCTARRIADGTYAIDDVLVYPQKVTGTTVDSSEKYGEWLMSHTDEEIRSIRCQCHSHVNMATNPSGTDISNNKEYIDMLGPEDFYIFMILNKRQEVNCKVYDLKYNTYYENDDIALIIGSVDYSDFIEEAKLMIEKAPVAAATYISQTKSGKESIIPYDLEKSKKDKTPKRFDKFDYYSGYYGGGSAYDSHYFD